MKFSQKRLISILLSLALLVSMISLVGIGSISAEGAPHALIIEDWDTTLGRVASGGAWLSENHRPRVVVPYNDVQGNVVEFTQVGGSARLSLPLPSHFLQQTPVAIQFQVWTSDPKVLTPAYTGISQTAAGVSNTTGIGLVSRPEVFTGENPATSPMEVGTEPSLFTLNLRHLTSTDIVDWSTAFLVIRFPHDATNESYVWIDNLTFLYDCFGDMPVEGAWNTMFDWEDDISAAEQVNGGRVVATTAPGYFAASGTATPSTTALQITRNTWADTVDDRVEIHFPYSLDMNDVHDISFFYRVNATSWEPHHRLIPAGIIMEDGTIYWMTLPATNDVVRFSLIGNTFGSFGMVNAGNISDIKGLAFRTRQHHASGGESGSIIFVDDIEYSLRVDPGEPLRIFKTIDGRVVSASFTDVALTGDDTFVGGREFAGWQAPDGAFFAPGATLPAITEHTIYTATGGPECDCATAIWDLTTPATCSAEGVETREGVCPEFGANHATRSVAINPNAHNFSTVEWNNAEHWVECAYCELEQTDSRANHIFTNWVDNTDGTETAVCDFAGCDADQTRNITFTVSIDSTDVATVNQGATFTFPPSTATGFIAYTDGEGNFFDAGDTVTDIQEALAFTTVALEVNMERGAAMRLGVPSGIRFLTNVDTDVVEMLRDAGATVTMGTLIAPADLLSGRELTRAIEDSSRLNVVFASTDWHVDAATGFAGIAGTIANVRDANASRDFVGRGYVTVQIGDITRTIYAEYYDDDVANNTRSIGWIAERIVQAGDHLGMSETNRDTVLRYYDLWNLQAAEAPPTIIF